MSQPYDRVFNFSAGPSVLPVEVLEEAKEDLLNYKGCGISVMELSHRSKPFEAIRDEAEANFRKLTGVGDDYEVLFLQGGASLQFTAIPMSFLHGGTADYVNSGSWAAKAKEAAGFVDGSVNVVWSGKESNFNHLPDLGSLNYTAGAKYIHITTNETIQGISFRNNVPNLPAPLVADASSNILSEPLDLSKYSLVYAGAQKNMGPAGTVVVVIKKSFLERAPEKTHPMLDYRVQAENKSLYNTPPCWGIYMCGLNYQYLLKNGGLEGAKSRNEAKANLLYNALDNSGGFYKGHAQVGSRSIMNVTFVLSNPDLDAEFLAEAKALKLNELKGHRSVGGFRASIYNAFPLEGCQILADFMGDFAKRKG